MPEEFRSLAEMLRAAPPERPPESLESEDDATDLFSQDETSAAQVALLRDVRMFRGKVGEALDAAVETLLADIACDVLARELCIAPAAIGAIVDRALERYFHEEPIRVRVNPFDVARLTCDLPVIADGELREGDAVIELRAGAIDASLGVRLDAVLREAAR